MRRQISTLQQEVLAWQMQAEEAAAAAAPAGGGEMSAAQQAEYERLLEAQAAVEVELARREEEMAVMEAQYQEQAEMAEAELGRLREEVRGGWVGGRWRGGGSGVAAGWLAGWTSVVWLKADVQSRWLAVLWFAMGH